jgi:hypothetical protein
MKYFLLLLLFSGEVFAQNKSPYSVFVDSIDNSFSNYNLQILYGRIGEIECEVLVSTSIVYVDFKIGECYYLLLDHYFDAIYINYRGDTVAQVLNINVREEATVKCSKCPGGELIVWRRNKNKLQFKCLGVLVAATFPESFESCD